MNKFIFLLLAGVMSSATLAPTNVYADDDGASGGPSSGKKGKTPIDTGNPELAPPSGGCSGSPSGGHHGSPSGGHGCGSPSDGSSGGPSGGHNEGPSSSPSGGGH